jgi:hypothetical protein
MKGPLAVAMVADRCIRYDSGQTGTCRFNGAVNRGTRSVWLIIPLIYFLGWWQTGSLRQAFNGTIAWIIAFSVIALALMALDVGGFTGLTATPDSPAAAIAILGGFIGMWISNYFWRRRGGDPPRNPGKWERAARAMLGMDKKKKKKKKSRPAMQGPSPAQQMPPPPPPAQQPVTYAPVDAEYRPAPGSPPPPHQQPAPPPPPANGEQPQQGQPQMQPTYQAAPQAQAAPQQQAGFQQPAGNYAPVPQQAPSQPASKKSKSRTSPTANKYAKATGRALGAMFRSSDKKKKKSPNQ